MATVECDGVRVTLDAGEKVLDGLLRAGLDVPHGCRAGACQACLVRATRGVPPPAAQLGLKETLRAQGYFLACSAAPSEDLAITRADAGLELPATVMSIEPLGADVVRVRIAPEAPFPYEPGQFVNVVRADGLIRSYSLASLPDEDATLELHVRVLAGGRMSRWLADPSTAGAAVRLRGPAGQCFYVPGAPATPLVLAGAGTGLAPLVGIVRAALRAGHTGPIALLHGARTAAGLYLVDAMRELAARAPNFSYEATVLEGEPSDAVTVAPLDRRVFERFPQLSGYRVYLCGDPDLVQRMRKRAFLAGASLNSIHADAFVTAPPR